MKIFFTFQFIAGLMLWMSAVGTFPVWAEMYWEKTFQVYKNPSCGCCGKWVDYMRSYGYSTETTDQEDLNGIKEKFGIPGRMQSCHTAVWDDQYVFEGHIPVYLVKRFLTNPPSGARGLIVPAMPVGSPGMEVGIKFQPYDVFVLMQDGSTAFYARVTDRKQQYE